MKKRQIGFRTYDNNKEEEQNVQDDLDRKRAERQKAIAEFIGHNYSPIGDTSQKCYKTSAELAYDISNIIAVRPAELTKQLSDAGYRIEYLSGQPYWIMYEKS